MQARYYDPLIGRFYANDPVGFVKNNPVSFNRYAYANNNPYKYVDPDGEFAFLAIPAICAGGACEAALAATAGLVGFVGIMSLSEKAKEEIQPTDVEPEAELEPDEPGIKRQKQNEHINGTPHNKNRRKQDPNNPPSTWDHPEEADDLTQEAWKNGTAVPGQPNAKVYETGRRVGTSGDGTKGQSGVKVHMDKKGKIHGHPWGGDKSDKDGES